MTLMPIYSIRSLVSFDVKSRRYPMKHTALAPLLVASLWTSTFAVWGETQAPATTAPVSADFTNSFYALALSPDRPAFTRFSIDSLGKRALERNPVLTDQRTTPVAQLRRGEAGRFEYKNTETPDSTKPLWEMQCGEKSFSLKSHFVPGSSLPPFTLAIDQKANHATLLGLMKPGERRMQLPCVLHLPDMGSARITCNVPNQKVDYDARRYVRPSFVHVSLPPATAEHPEVEYTFHVEAFHPPIAGIEKNSLFDGFRRSYLNMFQVNPRVQMLANNSSSDPVPFTLFIYAEMAAHAPPLAPGLTCLDLVRMTLDQYLSGALGYGMKGYAVKPMDADLIAWKTPWTSLDTTPSLVLSPCIYVERSKDETWARLHYPELATWTRDMLLGDKDGNGLVEYPRTGNLGDRPTPDNRPANWWDTINFGHEDAYSNALVFRTCSKFSDLARKLGHADDAKFFSEKATKLRAAYLPAFLNPSTGVLAGWKSADGKLHDYWLSLIHI